MEYTIYVITNEVNGKEYVGVTCDLERRWRQHKQNVRNKQSGHLYNAMRKYRIEYFSIQVVESAETREQACELEKQWIADLDTYHGAGYNMTEGGDRPPVLTGEDHPMYGRTGQDAPMYGREGVSGENHPMYGVTGEDHPGSQLTGEDNPMYDNGEMIAGEDNPMYGRTGQDAPLYGVTGEDHPAYGRTGEDHPMYGHTGQDSPTSKLSKSEASLLKWYALNSNLTLTEVGKMFGVHNSQVSRIKRGQNWPNLDPKPPADNGQLRLPLGAT